MKHLLLTTIAAVLVVGCGPSMSIHKAAKTGNIEVIKQHLAAGTDVNAKSDADDFDVSSFCSFVNRHTRPTPHNQHGCDCCE
jgi:hypothetical protein